MKAEPEDVSSKIQIVGGEGKVAVKSTKKLAKMRTNIDIDMIKRRTISGFESIIERKKAKDAEERVRVQELPEEKRIAADEKPKTCT